MDAVPQPAHRYRLPTLLQDIRLLDLLELSGTTLEVSRLVRLSQPTVSRRYRALAEDFALAPNRRRPEGCCFGTSPTMRLLRLGADVMLHPLLAASPWLLPAPARFRPVAGWLELVRQGVLDGALVSGLELTPGAWPGAADLELLPLGGLPLALAVAAGRGAADPSDRPSVLVPNRAVAEGLQRLLQEQGLQLSTAGNHCHTAAQWMQRLARARLAMCLPALAPGPGWGGLQWLPLPAPALLPVWLALPGGWRQQAVLAHTAEQLLAHPGLVAPKGA